MQGTTPIEDQNRQLLCRVLAALENEEEAMALLLEMCTPKEIKYWSQRAATAELLMQGHTYGDIVKSLACEGSTISTATINRVNETIKKGGSSCLRVMIQRASGADGC